MSVRALLVPLLVVQALGACARAPALEWPVQVKLVQPSTDGMRIARQASDVAEVPVRYVAATNEQWHALALQCDDAAQCERALARLRADTSTYAGVDVDTRRRVHSP
jgi:hypothetical protein